MTRKSKAAWYALPTVFLRKSPSGMTRIVKSPDTLKLIGRMIPPSTLPLPSPERAVGNLTYGNTAILTAP